MRLALFQDIGSDTPPRVGGEALELVGYFRVSGYVEVEFPPLEAEHIEQQLAAIDKARGELREEFKGVLRALQSQRATLSKS